MAEKLHPISRYMLDHPSPTRPGEMMNQREFAELVGYTAAFISQLISGRDKCGANAATRISEKTGAEISVDELIWWGRD